MVLVSPLLGDQDLGPISPNRPSFSNGVSIAPLGHPSVEMGIRQTQLGRSTVTEFGDGASLRLGLAPNFEARIGIPSYFTARGPGAPSAGFGDAGLGFKWRVTKDPEARRWAFALGGDASFPTGTRELRTPQVQPVFTAIAAYLPNEASEVDVNLLAGRLADDAGSYIQYGASVCIGQDLGHRLGAFAELFSLWTDTSRIGAATYADTGVTRWLRQNLAVDGFVGHGLNGIGRDWFFGGGFSYRF